MSKSIKLKNNNYWDSSSITHNKQKLGDMINSITGGAEGGLVIKRAFTTIDCNDIRNYGTGLYLMRYGCTNTPMYSGLNNWHWYIIQISFDKNYCVQIATAVHSDDRVFIRHQVNGNWRAWKTLAFV